MSAAAGLALAQIGMGFLQSQGQKSAAAANAKVAEFNAQQMEKTAEEIIKQGQRDSNKIREQGAKIAGTQKAAFAANNIDAGYGSAAQVIESTFAMSAEDARNTETNAFMKAMGAKYDALSTRWQSDLNTANANFQATQSIATQGLQGAQTMVAYKNANGG